MADKSDEICALWPDCLNEPGGSLMGMISDADMLHMMEDTGKHSEPDISDVQKDSAHVPDAADDALDLEPPSKLQATCKLDSQAAKTKAHREKQRRAQLNNRYTELAALIDPNKTPKTDRNLILDDAVRVITQLRVENNQLRQLNKLLEERVQEQEAPHGQALYQSYLMSQGGLPPPSRVDGASTSNLMGVPAPQDAPASRDAGRPPSAPSTPMQGQAANPSTDPSMLAMQMMNVAMQLLQNKSGGTTQPGATHTGVAQTPGHPQWPQVAVPGMPAHVQHVPQNAPGALMSYSDGPLPRPGDALPSGGNVGDPSGGDGAQPGNSSPSDTVRESAPTSATVPCIGFKPHMLQAQQYMQGYGFPAIPGMAQGWPPASMMDQARDSKLRPPAA